jgi:hypothetical protein
MSEDFAMLTDNDTLERLADGGAAGQQTRGEFELCASFRAQNPQTGRGGVRIVVRHLAAIANAQMLHAGSQHGRLTYIDQVRLSALSNLIETRTGADRHAVDSAAQVKPWAPSEVMR